MRGMDGGIRVQRGRCKEDEWEWDKGVGMRERERLEG